MQKILGVQCMFTQSTALFEEAKKYIPGGVNSPVRAFGGVGGTPIFFKRGEGAYLWDVDGNRYIDYVGSWGPAILGHAHPAVVAAVQAAAANGLSFGAPTEGEIRIAQKIRQHIPSMEQVRLVSSGTEAVMSALRLARGITQRDKIVKFAGGYHGHSDALLVKPGSGSLTLGIAGSPGVPEIIAQATCVAPHNDLAAVENIFQQIGEQIAAVIVEPIAGNMNCIFPVPGFLEGLRKLCDRYGSLLIFDEVITGFRIRLGGVQTHYQIEPDLTTLGKIIGGGMPVGAFGGKEKWMQHLAPQGSVYQAGTLSGNPVAVASGLATLSEVEKPGFYEQLAASTEYYTAGLRKIADQYSIPLQTQAMGGIFGVYFSEHIPTTLAEVLQCNEPRFKQYFHGLLKEGVYIAPSAYEAGFMSIAHTREILDQTLQATETVFKTLSS
ncbi:MAG: glutamate-1-semialdehyde 2,1-aminomutase [Gammaproteobacteria bacterium]